MVCCVVLTHVSRFRVRFDCSLVRLGKSFLYLCGTLSLFCNNAKAVVRIRTHFLSSASFGV
jgi:hypothetical protein